MIVLVLTYWAWRSPGRVWFQASSKDERGSTEHSQMFFVLGAFRVNSSRWYWANFNQGLLRRESLSAVQACNMFIEKRYSKPVRMWATFFFFVSCDGSDASCRCWSTMLAAAWSPRVFCFDASEWGRGVCQKSLDPGVVKGLGRFVERWRFKDPSAVPTRLLASDLILEAMLASGEYGDVDAATAALATKASKPGKRQRDGQRDWSQYLEAEHRIPLVPSDIIIGGWEVITSLP